MGPQVIAVLGAVVTWLTAGSTGIIGSALAALLAIVGGLRGFTFYLMLRPYLGFLASGAMEKASAERQSYDSTRQSLLEGNIRGASLLPLAHHISGRGRPRLWRCRQG